MNSSGSLYSVRILDRAYNEEMLEILSSSPIESGGLEICFDRKPDIFKLADIKYSPAVYVGFFRKEKLMGFAAMCYHLAFVNSSLQSVFHFTDFYVKKEARNKGFLYKASKELFENLYADTKIGYSIVMHGNKNALSHVSRRHAKFPDIPYSKVIETLDVKSLLITFKKKESLRYNIRKATATDIQLIVSLLKEEYSQRLFGVYVDERTFMNNMKKRPDFGIENFYIAENDGEIIGVCAAWDTSSFKQNRITKLSQGFKMTKFLYTALARLFNFAALPDEGECLKDVCVTDYAVKNRDPDVMNALLCKIYNEYRLKRYNSLIFGSCANDPLLNATKGFFKQSVKSHIILAAKDENLLNDGSINIHLPYIDIALL